MDPFELLEQYAATLKEQAARLAADATIPDAADAADRLAQQAAYVQGLRGQFGGLLAKAQQPVRNPLAVNAELAAPPVEILTRFRDEFGPDEPQRQALVRSLVHALRRERPAPAGETGLDREIWKDWGDE